MPPALRLPVGLDMDSFDRDSDKLRSAVSSSVRFIGREFERMNTEAVASIAGAGAAVTTGWAQTAAGLALRFAAIAGTGVAAFTAIGVAVAEGRRQLEEMVDVAERAIKLNVSPEFLQSFIAAEKEAKDAAEDLEKALAKAFESTKEHADRTVPVLEKLKELYLAGVFAQGDKATGLDLFRNAQSQESKVRALLVAMKELMDIGQRLEALDLGEKAFGAAFVDKIRTGQREVKSLLDELDRRRVGGAAAGDIISNEQALRAKELNDRLIDAWKTVSDNLKPSWDQLGEAALNIKGLWTDIVELLARATSGPTSAGEQLEADARARAAELRAQLARGTGSFGLSLTQGAAASMKEELAVLDGWLNELDRRRLRADALRGQLDVMFPSLNDLSAGGNPFMTVPLPQPRPDTAPKKKEETETRDMFDSATDRIERRSAAMQAEADNISKNTQEREKARIVAELETVAIQANTAAGKDNTAVTAEQRDRINEVADAYGKAAAAIARAHLPLQTFAREAANVDKTLNTFAASSLNTVTDDMAAAVVGTKSLADAFRSMANSILSDLARIAIRQAITGPIAAGIASLIGVPSVLPGGLPLGQGGIGHNAQGTDNWSGGPTWVGEEGPEILNLPPGSRITPAPVVRNGGSGAGGDINVNLSMDLTGANGDATIARVAREAAQQAFVAGVRTASDQFPARALRLRMLGT